MQHHTPAACSYGKNDEYQFIQKAGEPDMNLVQRTHDLKQHKVMLLAELSTGICQKMAAICMNLLD